ncbi:helix-turn-helix domain-containing protein [Paenibacillus hunanensis]|uniref:Transcriptional regulator with XRE-family HTH domain n=1 Tax=Paenibacillus hunanensis TaxID=539262 RepID=A0ABU1IWY3_9BACL|nr:helix-turn-helix transcriptional regulator [Paenibacillus hunanensis]MDR6243436.1 transcriptional regulator with XRE-family HTH domain [Paenibacillus hunanensis]GGI97713.1 hypothetical protein GCM10008022_03010 [Paenibacillus hunanensis]
MNQFNLHFIQKRRDDLNLTLKEMAEEFGMKNASNYSKYETGFYAFKAKDLPKLAIKLKCDVTNFFS